MPNILLVYPKFPLSYWGFQFAMDFVGRKACMPPLGLVTVAGMFPNETYKLRVVDMDVETLSDAHLSWADGGALHGAPGTGEVADSGGMWQSLGVPTVLHGQA